jgi:chemotaxis protein methyltransferase CheR
MVYSPSDYYRLDSRIHELIKINDVCSPEELYSVYKNNPSPNQMVVLINQATNNETYFFRDMKPFMVFSKKMLPKILECYPTEEIRLWSAACSTGQEAYSILMSLQNAYDPLTMARITVDGSDISTRALQKAKSGIYNGLDVQRGLPASLLVKYFSQLDSEKWQFNQQLMSKASFFEFNLLNGFFSSEKYHIIFCRNILIYQDQENKIKILGNLHQSLKKGGYLVMGSGESLIGLETPFETVQFDDFNVFKKST